MNEPTTNTDEATVLEGLIKSFESYDQSTVDARQLAERDRDYRNGKQWTTEDEATLKKRKQPVITIDRIGPKVDALQGIEQQHRSDPRAFPRTPQEEDGANAATDALRYVMDDQRWDEVRSACFENLIVEGACGVDVRVVEKYGEPCIEVLPILWDRMWGDEHSRKRNWSDGKAKGQVLWMDKEDALARWPDKADAIESTLSQEQIGGDTYDDVPRTRWADPKRQRVRVVEGWTNEGKKVFYNAFTKGGLLERTESPYKDEDDEQDDGFVFGSCFIDRDGNRFGVVRRWISIQDEINKRRSKALHLFSVRQTFGNALAGDKNQLRRELAKADGHVEMVGEAKFGQDFGILPTGDMAQGQFELLQEAKSEIDAVGANAAVQGKDNRVQSGRALHQREQAGLAELGPVMDAHKQFQLDVYRKVWNRIRQFWTAEKWIRVTDDEKNVRFVGLNQPLTLGDQLLDEAKKQGRQITPEMEQQSKMDPAMQQVVGVKNKVAELDVDISIDDAPASPSIQVEQFEALAAIAPNAGAMPPPLFKALIKASSLRNKEQILEDLEGGDQPNPQLMQMKAEMQEMQKALQEAQQATQEAQMAARRQELMAQEKGLLAMDKDIQLRAATMSQGQTDPAVDTLRNDLERELAKIAHERELLAKDRQLFEAQKRIAVLEVRAAETNMSHAAEQMAGATQELSVAAAEAEKPTSVETID